MASPGRRRGETADPAEAVAAVLAAKRDVLLRVHRHRLEREDLEDCLSQAALELIGRARDNGLHDERHVANALEQKFLSRVTDRQRALGGRSAIAAATRDAVRFGDKDAEDGTIAEIAVHAGEPAEAAAGREELQRLREVAADLTDDQRLVLACQVSLGMGSAEFCERFGWSAEKFKKVGQRARARLRTLIAEYDRGDRCVRLEADIVAYASDAASAPEVAAVREHLANCAGCAAFLRGLRLTSHRVGALLPIPVVAKAGLVVKGGLLAKMAAAVRAVTVSIKSAAATAAGTATASGGLTGVTAAAIATVCVTGVAGGAHWAAPRLGSEAPEAKSVSGVATAPAAATSSKTPVRSASRDKDGALRVDRDRHSERRSRRFPERRRARSTAASRTRARASARAP